MGIAIQHGDSEEEELFFHDSMQIRPEEFDFEAAAFDALLL